MTLKKKLKVFALNWLGVIIAVIILVISGSLVGIYLYDRNHVDNTLMYATQLINLKFPNGLYETGPTSDPSGYVFHLVIEVGNMTPDAADVTLSDIKIMLDTYTFDVLQYGSWNNTVTKESENGTGYEYFEGDFTIDTATVALLAGKGTVDIDIKGNVYASTQYKWVKKHGTRNFDINVPSVPFELIQPAT
jgi:hypothetical protein